MKKFFPLLIGILFISLDPSVSASQNIGLESDPVSQVFDKFIFHENFDSPVFPPLGYSSNIISGLGNWVWKDQGDFPETFPQDGRGMISYESFLWDAGSSAVLITTPVNIPASNYRVRFSMYRDASYPAALDRVEVLANDKNNNVSTATTLGVVHRHIAASPAVSEEGWYYFDFPIGMSGNVYLFFKAISQNGANLHLDAFFIELVPPAQPSVGVIPTAIDFRPVPVDYAPDTKLVRLYNIGDGTLTINQGDISITGPDAIAFSLSAVVFPIQLQKYQSVDFQVGYSSSSPGLKNAFLNINHNGANSPISTPITAESYAPLSFFYETFDGVAAPFLPPIWNKIVQSASSNAFIGTFTEATPASPPNHTRMFNSSDNNAQLYLVTPAVSGFAVNWLGFKAKTFSSNQLLKIGTLADPRNPETFHEIDRIIVPAGTYTQFYIPFNSYTGPNQFLALLHGLGGTNRAIYIDDVVWETMPTEPVFSVTPTSKDFGQVLVGTNSSAQSFTIRNLGGGLLVIDPSQIAIGGENSGEFILNNLNEQVQLSYNQTATFSVIFAPQSVGLKNATIYIDDDIPKGTIHQIPLNGSGFENVISNFPWTETFEDNSNSRPAWTQIREVGSAFWTFASGSSGGNILSPFEGTLNARFVSVAGTNSPITKLISPFLDLSEAPDPGLVFYLGQQTWVPDQNETKIYYRISESDPWVQLAHYTENISEWTRKYLSLPNSSSTYQLAFEGINNYGRANVLDKVSVCPELLQVSVSVTADIHEVCQGELVGYTATPVNGGVTPHYQWKVNGADAGTGASEFMYAPAPNDQVSVLLTSSEVCTLNNEAESNVLSIQVHPVLPVSVIISADQTEVCVGGMVTFTAASTNGGSNPVYQWKVNGIDNGNNSPVFVYMPSDGDQVAVIVTSSEVCTLGNPATSNVINLSVAPLLPVSVTITPNQTEVCFNSQVTFTATPFNGGTSPHYQWRVNGSNAGSNSSVFTYFPNHGDEVSVILTSNSTCASGNPATSNVITMTVNPLLPVSASITASEPQVCQGTQVTFTATPVNGGTTPAFQWKVNGTNTGTNSPTFTYTPSHNDQVSVVITSSEACTLGNPVTSNVVTMTVYPNLPVSVSISASSAQVCAGTQVTFTASALNGGATPVFQWKVNGTITGTNSHTFSYTPVHGDQVSVVLTSSEACTSGNPATSNIVSITVNPDLQVSVSISASTTQVCSGTQVTFTAIPVNGGSSPAYQWKVNGINVGGNAPQYTYAPADGDQVSVVLTSSEVCATGNPSPSNLITIAVNPLLPVSVSISASENNVCAGTPVTFTASAVNGGSSPAFQWKVNGSNVAGNSPQYTFTPADGDQVSVVLTSSEACASGSPATSNIINMAVNPLLPVSVSISASDNNVCAGTVVTFTATAVNGGSSPVYLWKVNGSNVGISSPTYTYTPANNDQVSVVLTSSEACAIDNPATSNTLVMNVFDNPLVTWNWTPEPVYQDDEPIVLSGGSPLGGLYSGLGVAENIFNPLVAGPGIHLLTYTYTNVNECSGSANVSIEVLESPDCGIPTGLTVSDITINSAGLSWVAGNNHEEWILEWGIEGFSPGSGTLVTGLVIPEYSLSGLTEETTYQFFVKGICEVGISSSWAGPVSFITLSSQVEIVCPEDFTVCIAEPAFELFGGSPSGGVYSGNGVSDNMFYPTVAGEGLHTISYTYQDQSCQFIIAVQPLLMASVSITVDHNEVCEGSEVTLTATTVNGGTDPVFQWKVNGINAGDNSPVFTYVPVNGDVVIVEMTSSESCVEVNPVASNSIESSVTPSLPVSVAVIGGSHSVCEGITKYLIAIPFNGGDEPVYQWMLNGEPFGLNNPVLLFTPSNGDRVWVLVTSSEICTTGNPASSNEIVITVNPKPEVTWNWEYESVCVQTPSLSLEGVNPEGGTFSGPGVAGNQFYPSVAGIGTHTLSYIFFDEFGCYNFVKVEIIVDACTDVAEPEVSDELLLYPNPARHTINFTVGREFHELKQIIVFDMQGNLLFVKENPPPQEVYILDIQNFPQGIYFLLLRSEKGIIRGKFVVM